MRRESAVLAPVTVQVTLPSSGSLKEAGIQQLLSFHSGAIVGLATSPYGHHAITAGADGTVRLHDYWYAHCLPDLGKRGREVMCTVSTYAQTCSQFSKPLLAHEVLHFLIRSIAHSSYLAHYVTHFCITHLYIHPPVHTCVSLLKKPMKHTILMWRQSTSKAMSCDQLFSCLFVATTACLLDPWRLTRSSCPCQGKLLLLCTSKPDCDSTTLM